MNDRQLASFVASFEADSFRKAAQDTYLTVPSLVKRIESLENELGYELFVRNTQGITPTAAGVRFYERAKDILCMMSGAKEESDGAATISLGIWDRAPDFILEATSLFSKKHPTVLVDFVETDGMQFPEDLYSEKIDLYLGYNSVRAKQLGLFFEECGQYRVHCLCAPQSILARHECVDTQALENYLVYAGSDMRDIPDMPLEVRTLFSRDNVVKKSIFTEKLIADCLQDKAVTFGVGNTYSLSPSCLVSRPLTWPKVSLGISFRPNASAVLREFIDMCKKNYPTEED